MRLVISLPSAARIAVQRWGQRWNLLTWQTFSGASTGIRVANTRKRVAKENEQRKENEGKHDTVIERMGIMKSMNC